MSPDPQPDEARQRRRLRYPRPGHADLAGALKHDTADLRNVLERAVLLTGGKLIEADEPAAAAKELGIRRWSRFEAESTQGD